MTTDINNLIRNWARIGAGFDARPAAETPDLERLLLDTARNIQHEPRLFLTAASWLCRYYELVAKHRLQCLIGDELEPQFRAVLGLFLDVVAQYVGTDHFRSAIEACRPHANSSPEPLYEFQRSNPALAKLAERRASDVSRQWNRWAEAFEPKSDAVRPASWVFDHNPTYRLREGFTGDLRSTIVETLRTDQAAGRSESELARRCRASRDALRKAVDRLERYGHVERKTVGKFVEISLAS